MPATARVPWEKEYIGHMSRRLRAMASPGPAAYDIDRELKGAVPVIKMKGRHDLPKDKTDVPYYNTRTSIDKVTPIKMHGRTKMHQPEATPGPTYIPPAFGSDARKVGFAAPDFGKKPRASSARRKTRASGTALGRRGASDETPGPGPGAYSTRGRDFEARGTKGVQIKGSHDLRLANTESPGPGTYVPQYDKVMPSAPKYGIRGRAKEKRQDVTPGYRNLGSTLSGPRYSMKARATDDIFLF